MQKMKHAINLPVDAFTTCPSCRSSSYLRELSFDVYCHGCGWDSSSAFVEAGGLDALIYEYEKSLEQQASQGREQQKMRRAI
jgi:hypothetical protein